MSSEQNNSGSEQKKDVEPPIVIEPRPLRVVNESNDQVASGVQQLNDSPKFE